MATGLFHYTDAHALKSILIGEKLWLTDMRFLNDAAEYADGLEYLKFAWGVMQAYRGHPKHEDLFHKMETAMTYAIGKQSDGFPKFVCSFSRAGDLLSQWRSYGLYAIEFDEQKLSEHLELTDCVYDIGQKHGKAMTAVRRWFSEMLEIYERMDENYGIDFISSQKNVDISCAFFKHQSFFEEREVRCMVAHPSNSENIEYRVRAGILVPYCERYVPLECIAAIHIGPMQHQESSLISVEMMLQAISKKHKKAFDIKVVKSAIPYRNY
ncbi:hypothetical protein ACOYXF_14390 [Pseudomonas sp. Tul1A2]